MLQKQPPRRFFKLSVLFFRSNLFSIFQEGLFVSRTNIFFSRRVYLFVASNRHVFSRRVYITCSTNRHIHIFQEGLSKKPYYLIAQKYTNFSRNPFLVLEHIQIFQEPLIFHQTDIHFPESPILSSP